MTETQTKTVIEDHHVDDASSCIAITHMLWNGDDYYQVNPKGSRAMSVEFHQGPPVAGRVLGMTVPAILAVALHEMRRRGNNAYAEKQVEDALLSYKSSASDTLPPGEIIEVKPKKARKKKTIKDD